MTGDERNLKETPPAQTQASPRLLAVGDLFPPDMAGAGDTARDITYLAFEEVTAEALDRLRPDIVLSPLVSPGFDCFDLAGVLVGAGFRGLYRAVAPEVPNPGLVRREIADLFPGLDFDMLLLDRPA